jgi:hypothetical protein
MDELNRALESLRTEGRTLDFETVPDRVFEQLFKIDRVDDSDVAECLNCSEMDVMIRRHKLNIPLRYKINDRLEQLIGDREVNAKLKKQFMELSSEDIAKGIVHYIFRNGPVESIHDSDKGNSVMKQGDVLEHEMELLNKFMYNRMYYLIDALRNDRWVDVVTVLDSQIRLYGNDWDKPFDVSNERNEILNIQFDK